MHFDKGTHLSTRNRRQANPVLSSGVMRGVSPLIRGHLRSTSNEMLNQGIFMTNMGMEPSTSQRQSNVPQSMVGISLGKITSQPVIKDIHKKNEVMDAHKRTVQEIITKVRILRGSNPTNSNLKLVNEKV